MMPTGLIPLLIVLALLSDRRKDETLPREVHIAPVVCANWSQQYVVVKGDTLSKLARKSLGADSKANRDAIIKLNPSLKKNPDLLIIGQKLMLPGRQE